MIKTILYYEWKLFLRNKGILVALVMMLLTGLYSVYYAKSFQEAQLSTIHTLDTAYQNRIKTQLDNFSADTSTKEGKARYKNAHDPFMNEWATRPMIWKNPQPLQALSIGQSDNQPFYFGLWVYNDNVYTNKKIELRNPDKLQAGNFDLSFVIVYLFPLLIIAFGYAVYSSDREQGTVDPLKAQGIPVHRIILGRLLFRFIIIGALNMLLALLAFIFNGIYSAVLAGAWLLISSAYIFFWFCLVYLVAMAEKSSSLSALLLISCWILLLMVIPAFFSDSQKQKDAERIGISDAEREYSIHLWRLWQSKSPHLLDTLYKADPQWTQTPIKDTDDARSVAYSYLNIMHLNNQGWQADSMLYMQQQNQLSYRLLNPAYCAQYAFNQLAGTEADQFIGFKKAAAAYHKQRVAFLGRLRISETPFTITVLKSYPVFRQPENPVSVERLMKLVWPLLALSLLCWLTATAMHSRK
jgi:ABC-2 type transport system permease protein